MSAPKLADIEFDVLNVRNADRVVAMIFDDLIASRGRDDLMAAMVREKCPGLYNHEIFVMNEDEHNALLYSVFHLSETVKKLYARCHELIGGDGPMEGAAP